MGAELKDPDSDIGRVKLLMESLSLSLSIYLSLFSDLSLLSNDIDNLCCVTCYFSPSLLLFPENYLADASMRTSFLKHAVAELPHPPYSVGQPRLIDGSAAATPPLRAAVTGRHTDAV